MPGASAAFSSGANSVMLASFRTDRPTTLTQSAENERAPPRRRKRRDYQAPDNDNPVRL